MEALEIMGHLEAALAVAKKSGRRRVGLPDPARAH
jgi:hypothetical protein